jgi:hypothetical protein
LLVRLALIAAVVYREPFDGVELVKSSSSST